MASPVTDAAFAKRFAVAIRRGRAYVWGDAHYVDAAPERLQRSGVTKVDAFKNCAVAVVRSVLAAMGDCPEPLISGGVDVAAALGDGFTDVAVGSSLTLAIQDGHLVVISERFVNVTTILASAVAAGDLHGLFVTGGAVRKVDSTGAVMVAGPQSGVVDVAATDAGGIAVRGDGSVVGIGENVPFSARSGVSSIYAAFNTMTAIKAGRVISWSDSATMPVVGLPGDVGEVVDVVPGARTVAIVRGRLTAGWIGGSSSGFTSALLGLDARPVRGAGVTSAVGPSDGIGFVAKRGELVPWGGPPVRIPARLRSGVTSVVSRPAGFGRVVVADDSGVWTIRSGVDFRRLNELVATDVAASLTDVYALVDGQVVAANRSKVPDQAKRSVTSIESGFTHMLALTNSGRVVAWGDNFWGQASVPRAARSGVRAIAAGNAFSLALKDGGVISWGSLGPRSVPQEARSGVSQIAAGGGLAMAVKNGRLISWGDPTCSESARALSDLTNVVSVTTDGCQVFLVVSP